MAEVLEYSLVVLVSMLFVSGSVLTYDAFSSFASGLQFRLASNSISSLAGEAAADGGAAGAIAVPASNLSCHRGLLSFTSGAMADSQRVTAGCDFALSLSGGVHTFRFQVIERELTLTVS